MKGSKIYEKTFSEIRDWQKARTQRFALLENCDGRQGYGVELEEDSVWGHEQDELFPLTDSREEAMALLTFLYENCIRIADWRGVVRDLLKDGHRLVEPLSC